MYLDKEGGLIVCQVFVSLMDNREQVTLDCTVYLKQNIKLSQCLAPSKSVGANQLSVKSEKVQGREGGREERQANRYNQ